MHLDKQHPQPVYLQLKEMLQSQIEQGVYVSHQKLPSERDLCQQYDLSRMTARRALKALIADGLAYTRIGKGTFVNQQTKLPKAIRQTDFSQVKAQIKNGLIDARLYQKLLNALASFDCTEADQTIREVLSKHSLELVAGGFFPEIIKYSEQNWNDGTTNLIAHNYAITTIRSQLISMMNAAATVKQAPKILLACAPDDLHEIGLILLALNLRRRNLSVIYLGSTITVNDFHQAVKTAKPDLICISAATDRSVENLYELSHKFLQEPVQKKQIFTYGGVAFSQNPTLKNEIPGTYLGTTIKEAVAKVQTLINVSD